MGKNCRGQAGAREYGRPNIEFDCVLYADFTRTCGNLNVSRAPAEIERILASSAFAAVVARISGRKQRKIKMQMIHDSCSAAPAAAAVHLSQDASLRNGTAARRSREPSRTLRIIDGLVSVTHRAWQLPVVLALN
jgi:hypothetical protein